MKRIQLASALAAVVAAIGVGEARQAELVEVFAPSVWREGRAFEVRAEAAPGRCKPRRWTFTAPQCEVSPVAKDTARLTCFGAYAPVAATPVGRGCKGWVGATSITLTKPTLPPCPTGGPPLASGSDWQGDPDGGALPGGLAEIDPSEIHLYYRPGVQSTGRLNLRVFACRPGGRP